MFLFVHYIGVHFYLATQIDYIYIFSNNLDQAVALNI